jgi:hypothetical protein
MEILKIILAIIGISTASLFILTKMTAGVFTPKITAQKIALALGSICLVDIIVFISIFGASPMFIIAIICWPFGLIGLISEIKENK